METTAITYHEAHGLPPRMFHLTFEIAGDRHVKVTCDGSSITFRFHGQGYRPTCRAHRQNLIERFLERESKDEPIEQINAELLNPGRASRAKLAACVCHDDRQLPAGDRT